MIRWVGIAAGVIALAVAAFFVFGPGLGRDGAVTPGVKELAIPGAPALPDLTLTGAIARNNGTAGGKPALHLDLEAIRDLPQRDIDTTTTWTDGTSRFRGPLLRDVLAYAGAGGTRLVATAVNDYFVTIPVEDALRYDVILAHEMDGEPLKRSDKGPLWVVYPESEHSELLDPLYNGRWIWQLKKIEVQ